jgi:hypothetical protein
MLQDLLPEGVAIASKSMNTPVLERNHSLRIVYCSALEIPKLKEG